MRFDSYARTIRGTGILAVGAALLCWPARTPSQEEPRPEPTALETMASQGGTEVLLDETVSEIASDDARAAISALDVENRWLHPSRARGVRIDLRNETGSEPIFVDADGLARLRSDLASMDCGIEETAKHASAPRQTIGIARCRPSQTAPQAFCPSYRMAPEFAGFTVSTFAGGAYRFPSVRPSVFAAAIGKAMAVLDVDPDPYPEAIAVSDADLERIVNASIRNFPELASSPGVKAARYSDREDHAWVIFQPHERMGDLAYARMVECAETGETGKRWQCDRIEPRTYLTLQGQSDEVVIPGEIGRDTAMSLIDVTRQALSGDAGVPDPDDWSVRTIHPPDQHREEFWITWTDGSHLSMFYEVQRVENDDSPAFRIVRATAGDDRSCG